MYVQIRTFPNSSEILMQIVSAYNIPSIENATISVSFKFRKKEHVNRKKRIFIQTKYASMLQSFTLVWLEHLIKNTS